MMDKTSHDFLADTRHQVRPNFKAGTVTVLGHLAGTPYGVVIDVKNHSVEWDSTRRLDRRATPQQTTRKAKKPEKTSDAEGCSGCLKGLRKMIRGGLGWAKVAIGHSRAEPEIVASRKATCMSCPSQCYEFGVCRDDFSDRAKEAQGCGCILSLKVLVKTETCPHGHWNA